MARLHPTIDYVARKRPDSVHLIPPPDAVPPNRMPAGRLSFSTSEIPLQISDECFADMLDNSALPDAEFFLDTCFVTGREVPQLVWDALLRKRILIAPLVWEELRPWLAAPRRNRVLRDVLLGARESPHPAVQFLEPIDRGSDLGNGMAYYVGLLAARKEAFEHMRWRLSLSLKREPSEEETNWYVQRHGRPAAAAAGGRDQARQRG